MGTTLTAVMVEDADRAARARRRQPRLPAARGRPAPDHERPHARGAHGEGRRDHPRGSRRAPPPQRRHALARHRGRPSRVDEDTIALLDDDRLLICSDGLTGMVHEDQIQAILEAEPDPQRAADRLVKAANRAGGVDNITVVVLDAHTEDGDPPPGELPAPSRRPSVRRVIAGVLVATRRARRRCCSPCAPTSTVSGTWASPTARSPSSAASRPARSASRSPTSTPRPTICRPTESPALEVYRDLAEGISAESRDEAFAIVEQMRADVDAQADGRRARRRRGIAG